jgi:Strictosidine synthase
VSSVVVGVIRELLFRDRDRGAIPVLDGPMRPNSGLETCPVLCDTVEEPDDIAFSTDGAAYVASRRQLIRFAGVDFTGPTVAAEFDGPVTAVASHPGGGVVACVPGHGIVFVDGADKGRLLSFSDMGGLKCPTSLVVGKSGDIYVCDGSLDNPPTRWVYDLMEKRHSGRVLRVDPVTNEIIVLASEIAYPNGICFAQDGQSLIVSEAWSHDLLRVPTSLLKSSNSRPQAIIQNLCGYPARIASLGDGYCLTMFALRTQLVDFVLTEDAYRAKMIEQIDPAFWIAPALRSEGHYLEPVQGGGLKKHGSLKAWAPPRSYGLVVFLDYDFEPESSLHSRVGGSCHGVTGVAALGGEVYVTSKGNNKILRLAQRIQ